MQDAANILHKMKKLVKYFNFAEMKIMLHVSHLDFDANVSIVKLY